MATHSSILAWRIPWTDGPGRVESMGLQRIGHDWVTNTFTSLSMFIEYVHLHQKTTKEKELVSIFIYQNSESCLSKINDYIESCFFFWSSYIPTIPIIILNNQELNLSIIEIMRFFCHRITEEKSTFTQLQTQLQWWKMFWMFNVTWYQNKNGQTHLGGKGMNKKGLFMLQKTYHRISLNRKILLLCF